MLKGANWEKITYDYETKQEKPLNLIETALKML